MGTASFDRAFRRLTALTDYETMATVPTTSGPTVWPASRGSWRTWGAPARAGPSPGGREQGEGDDDGGLRLHPAGRGPARRLLLLPHLVHPPRGSCWTVGPCRGGTSPGRWTGSSAGAAAGGRGPRDVLRAHDRGGPPPLRGGGRGRGGAGGGMGGRLDATTAPPRCAVLLSSVSLDHTRQLGRTTAAIASEKAAAARRGRALLQRRASRLPRREGRGGPPAGRRGPPSSSGGPTGPRGGRSRPWRSAAPSRGST